MERQSPELNSVLEEAHAPRTERLLSVLSFLMFVAAVSVAYSPFLGVGVVIGVIIARLHYRH